MNSATKDTVTVPRLSERGDPLILAKILRDELWALKGFRAHMPYETNPSSYRVYDP